MSTTKNSSSAALQPGTRLSHYLVQERLGGGGMGTVYRARDTRLSRDVAIKVINTEIAGDAERVARFHREARAVAALNHPGIVTIHDTGEEHGTPYIVTELVDGTTVRTLLADENGLGTRRVIEIGSQVAEALAAAHGAGRQRSRRLRPGMCGSVAPAWSPDGAWIACGRDPMGLDLVPAAGGQPHSVGALCRARRRLVARFEPALRHPRGRRELGEVTWRTGAFPADFRNPAWFRHPESNELEWTSESHARWHSARDCRLAGDRGHLDSRRTASAAHVVAEDSRRLKWRPG